MVILFFNLEVSNLNYVSPDIFFVENVKRENPKTFSGGKKDARSICFDQCRNRCRR